MKQQGLLEDKETENPTVPDPKAFEDALKAVAEFVDSQSKLYHLIAQLSRLLPPKNENAATSPITISLFIELFVW